MLTKKKNLTENSLEVMQIAVAQEKKEKWNNKEVQGEKEFIWGVRNKMKKKDQRILREIREEAAKWLKSAKSKTEKG